MDDRHVTEQDAWIFAFIGKWFRFKDLELEDDPEFRSRHPSNCFKIHQLVHYDGTNRRFMPATVRYARKRLYFICYSVDNVSDYEMMPIKAFHPSLEERNRFYSFLTLLMVFRTSDHLSSSSFIS